MDIRQQVEAFLGQHDPSAEEPLAFLSAGFHGGLAGTLL